MKNFTKHLILFNAPVRDALKKLDELAQNLTLFVVDNENKLLGALTDGDIRRGLLKGLNISDSVSQFMFSQFHYLQRNNYSISKLNEFRSKKIKLVPVLDDEKKIIRLINFDEKKSILPIDAVIMAGGRGERLKPLTDTLPKPLIKIGNKPIIEYNIDRLVDYGVATIFITVKYLGEKVIEHLGNGEEKGVVLNYIIETEPMGTIGSVGLIKDFSHDYVLVMNSDLLTNIDYEDFFKSFIEEDADMAVASIPYNVDVPYAVLEKNQNRITLFKEKPTYTYYSNAGIYLIKRKLLDLIPIEKQFNATDFMQALINRNLKIIDFPVLGYWLDIGRMEDYNKAQKDIKHIKF